MCSVPQPGHTFSRSCVLPLIHIISFTTCSDVSISVHLFIRSWNVRVFFSQRCFSVTNKVWASFRLSHSFRIFSLCSRIFRPCWGVISSSFTRIPAMGFFLVFWLLWPSVHKPILVKLVGFTSLKCICTLKCQRISYTFTKINSKT